MWIVVVVVVYYCQAHLTIKRILKEYTSLSINNHYIYSAFHTKNTHAAHLGDKKVLMTQSEINLVEKQRIGTRGVAKNR